MAFQDDLNAAEAHLQAAKLAISTGATRTSLADAKDELEQANAAIDAALNDSDFEPAEQAPEPAAEPAPEQ